MISPGDVGLAMRLAKTIDELYSEVRDFDLVLCNDAPLALALNNRIDKPFVGTFAVTARQLAGELAPAILGEVPLGDVRTTKLLSEYTDRDLRFVHGELENIKEIRRYTREVGRHLGKKGKKILAEYARMPTLERAMASFDPEGGFYEGKKVAVIGVELFDELDKHMNPKFGTFEEISPFKRGEYRVETIYEVGNDRQLAENAAALITRETARDFAIVMDPSGPMGDAVRSALYRKGLPFKNSLSVRDLNHVREYLSFLSLALSYDTLRFGQVREQLSSYGGFVPSRYDRYLVSEHGRLRNVSEKTRALLGIMESIGEMTFLEACEGAVPAKRRAQIKIMLGELDMSNARVNANDLNTIGYAVDNLGDLKHNEQIPEDEKDGVLLVDCKNSAYVDRPVVIFLGMGSDWERDLSSLDFLKLGEKKDERERDVTRFEILMQQGGTRIYMANQIKDGKKPKPCPMFDLSEGSGTESETFADVCDNLSKGMWSAPGESADFPFGETGIDAEGYEVPPLSKSSYNSFKECPRRYLFDSLVPGEDSDSTVIGTAMHDYAELRASHPGVVEAKGVDYFVDAISDAFAGLVSRQLTNVERTNVRNGIATLDSLFSSMDLSGAEMVESDGDNMFYGDLGLTTKSANCEFKVSSEDRHMMGYVDFLHDGAIYDYKTGRPKKMKDVVDQMLDNGTFVEFQPLFYLSLLDGREDFGGRFSFVFTKEDSMRAFAGERVSHLSGMRTVALYDSKLEFLRDHYVDDVMAGYDEISHKRDAVVSCIERHGMENVSKDNKGFVKDLHEAVDKGVTRSKCETMANRVSRMVEGNMPFSSVNNVACVTREFLDGFVAAVEEARMDIGRMSAAADGFPAAPRKGCKWCQHRHLCTREPAEGGEAGVSE